MDKWRSTFVKIVILELVLCVAFFVFGHITDNAYFRGVGVGLLISGVTGALAYLIVKRRV